ncbi:transcription cofactor vestigial-like protein 2 [Tachyglossus aculeatus]|uniref:transcription cofactor vestigial-like protein 2 n=1 Tax=Tachyglossus aculeatus TaxID=9261 RepID=UPI0018F6CAD3|nr:transcription cofactor vestigial-like protein 2 [Tachyglossus aculeatus]
MSCLEVMFPLYGPAQPYLAAAYSPYRQKVFYPKMQNASDSAGGSSSSFPGSGAGPGPVKEEERSPEKERERPPPEPQYLGARCVLFTYVPGDVGAVVDQHFSRALSQPSATAAPSPAPSPHPARTPRAAGPWRDGSFPMNQRSFPASFWNSAYQPAVPTALTVGAHPELPFAADPYGPGPLHGHLHQAAPEAWAHASHPAHHAAPHAHPPFALGAQGPAAYPSGRPATVHEVYGPHFDPRYSPLLLPGRPHRLPPAAGPAARSPPCELAKGEPPSGAWAAPGAAPFPGPAGDMGPSLGLGLDAGVQPQDKSKDLYWF